MNAETMFSKGTEPELEVVLYNREQRVLFIDKLLQKYPSDTVISLKCNIPGPVKNNAAIQTLFEYGMDKVNQIIKQRNWTKVYEKNMDLVTGPECFMAIEETPLVVKKQMVMFEEEELGRIFDADVLYRKEDKVFSLSRTELGCLPRKCFVCEENAKICSGRRIHPVQVLQQKIIEMINESGLCER